MSLVSPTCWPSGGRELGDPPRPAHWRVGRHRQTRTYKPPAGLCPLCPSKPGKPSEISEADYDVVVFEYRFPDHDGLFAKLSPSRVRMVVDAWADRTAALSEIDGLEQVFPFENRGEEIGVILHHPPGQIYGYPFVTPKTRRMLDVARAGDVLAAERATLVTIPSNTTRVARSRSSLTAFSRLRNRLHSSWNQSPHRHLRLLDILRAGIRRESGGIEPNPRASRSGHSPARLGSRGSRRQCVRSCTGSRCRPRRRRQWCQ